jgi:hypothetical protein
MLIRDAMTIASAVPTFPSHMQRTDSQLNKTPMAKIRNFRVCGKTSKTEAVIPASGTGTEPNGF